MKDIGSIRRTEIELYGNGVNQTSVALNQRLPCASITAEAQPYKLGIPERLVFIVAHLAQFPGLPEGMEPKSQGQKTKDHSSDDFPHTRCRFGKFSKFVHAIEAKNPRKDEQERTSDFQPKLVK